MGSGGAAWARAPRGEDKGVIESVEMNGGVYRVSF